MALVLAACLGAADLFASPAGAAASTGRGGIDVVQVEGYFDTPNESLVRNSIADANDRGSTLLILQLKSSGAIDAGVRSIVRALDRSAVPVAVWVGPSGADAKGAATVLLEAAHLAYISPGSGAGPGHPLQLDDPGASTRAEVADQLAALAERRGRNPSGARQLAGRRLGATEAKNAGATDGVRPTIGELIVRLDGKSVKPALGTRTLSTARVIGSGRDRRRQPNQEVRFHRLDLGGQIVHRLISPSIAYFLLVAGLALLVFEFYTAGIGLAGLVGALCVVGALGGFSHLPLRWWAFALLLFATFGFAVDVQVGSVGIWTAIGTVALVLGSLFLYGGSTQLRPAWWVLLIVCTGMVLFMVGGMTAMIRSRFSTPTVGREGMVGEVGTAEVDIDPDGVVLIRGARWRARTNRATPLAAGDPVRVLAVEGLVLEVEPPEGGARDPHDRARRSKPARG
jgi:membrane-bound serine protease (ClpP class)